MKILLAVPTRGSVYAETIEKLEAQRSHLGLDPILYVQNPISVVNSRNEIITKALASGYDRLVMVDDDIIVPPPEIASLSILTDLLDTFDVVGAACPIPWPAVPPIRFAAYRNSPDDSGWQAVERGWEIQGVQKVDAVGFGCVALNLVTLKNMVTTFHSENRVGEDLGFCRDVQDKGGTIACNFDFKCDHYRAVSLMTTLYGFLGAERSDKRA